MTGASMTVPKSRIRRGGDLLGRLLLALAAGAGVAALAGCNDPPPRPPTPPRELVPPVALSGNLDETPIEPALGKGDAWSDAYGAYMTRDELAAYVRTPESERFERFGLKLLDYQLREDLLREHKDDLNREQQDAYRHLPTADACRRYIAEHRPRDVRLPAAPGSPPEIAPVATGAPPPPRNDK